VGLVLASMIVAIEDAEPRIEWLSPEKSASEGAG